MLTKPKIILYLKEISEAKEISDKISRQGTDCLVCTSKEELISRVNNQDQDMVILDLNLKDADGISICQEIRSTANIHQPFIIICSESNEDYVQILAFNSGCDDYIIKPLKPLLLYSRMNAILKRKKSKLQNHPSQSEKIFIDHEEYLVYANNKRIQLPKKEFEMVNLFYTQPKKIFTRQEIARLIWGDETVAKQRTIDIHIRNIRKMLGKGLIKTVKGVGYGLSVN